MKKSSPTPDVNANAPRPGRVSSDDPAVPTMDTPPQAPADTATGFDRATAATDQEYRSGLLPGADDFRAREYTLQDEDAAWDADESGVRPALEPGADLEPDVEFDPDADAESAEEAGVDDMMEAPAPVDPVQADEVWPESRTFPQQDDPDQEAPLDEGSARPDDDDPANPNHEQIRDPENDNLGAVQPPGKR